MRSVLFICCHGVALHHILLCRHLHWTCTDRCFTHHYTYSWSLWKSRKLLSIAVISLQIGLAVHNSIRILAMQKLVLISAKWPIYWTLWVTNMWGIQAWQKQIELVQLSMWLRAKACNSSFAPQGKFTFFKFDALRSLLRSILDPSSALSAALGRLDSDSIWQVHVHASNIWSGSNITYISASTYTNFCR